MDPNWVREIRDQCVASATPFFFKQWGQWASMEAIQDDDEAAACTEGSRQRHRFTSGDVAYRVTGKRKAGRLLDGRTWDEMPSQTAGAI